jgi:hypothetical protein
MATVLIALQAGKKTRQSFGLARFLTFRSLGAAATVDVDIEVAGFATETLRNCRAGERIAVPMPGFESVTFTAPVDCTVEVVASMLDLRINNNEGSTVNANILGTVPVQISSPVPVPVVASRGDAPGNPFYVSGLTLDDTPAASLVDNAPVAVNETADPILAADATRLEARFTNNGTDPVALGGAGITWANRTIVVNPGDSWVEVKGAALAWYGITEAAGKTASVNTQVLTA